MEKNNEDKSGLERLQEELKKIVEEGSLYKYSYNNSVFINSSKSTGEKLEVKVARLIVLLNSIEEQLKTVEITLEKLWDMAYKNHNEDLKTSAREKLDRVKDITLKIQKAKLNLNYHLI